MKIKDFYNKVSGEYNKLYERENIHNIHTKYPANYFRLQMLINSFTNNNVKKVIEVGVGEGTPLCNLYKMGMDVFGFDISEEMTKKAKTNAKKYGICADNIFCADIQDSVTYAGKVKNDFDGLIAMGVMPHVEKDKSVINNMSSLLRPGGKTFIEFRNKLFSLFTFNEYTVDFIVNDLLSDVSDELRSLVNDRLSKIIAKTEDSNKDIYSEYKSIPSKFHNPFDVEKLFEECGFYDIKTLWYHYHSAPPFIGEIEKQLFRDESVKMENNVFSWKSMFLCSAFVIEATKK